MALAPMPPCSERDPRTRPQQGSFEGGHDHSWLQQLLSFSQLFAISCLLKKKSRFSSFNAYYHSADRKVSKFWTKGEKKTSQDVQGILFNVQSPLKKIIQNHHHHWCDGDRKKCCHTELNANPHRFSPLRSWMDPSFVSDHIDGELNTN